MDWIEITVAVDNEAVEAVSSYLHESGAGGTVIERVGPAYHVSAYFPAGPATSDLLAALNGFCRSLEGFGLRANAKITSKTVTAADWAEEWKKHYRPLDVGAVHICPSWLEPQAGPGQITVRLDPGLAFGTGSHATTKLCILKLLTTAPGNTVLDLGSGSGILSIVACKAGARKVDAVDNDELALKVAAENAVVNGCAINQINGDAFAKFAASEHAVTVANISFDAGYRLAEIYRQRGKQGTLIISGFPQERLPEFLAAYGDLVREEQVLEGWVGLVLGGR